MFAMTGCTARHGSASERPAVYVYTASSMPDHQVDRDRGNECGRRWSRDEAQRSEHDQLRYMYEQQGLGPASVEMGHWHRCLKLADEIGSTALTKWQTLWNDDWHGHEDRHWRAGFVEGALEFHEVRVRA
jgi:hypothetical protein